MTGTRSPGATNPDPTRPDLATVLQRLCAALNAQDDVTANVGPLKLDVAAHDVERVTSALRDGNAVAFVVPKTRRRAAHGSRPLTRQRNREHRPTSTRRTSSSSRTSSSDPGSADPDEPEPPAHGRLCAAAWCGHRVYGPPQQRYCRTERCTQARAKERKRTSRAALSDPVALDRAQRLNDAVVAGYVGERAFGPAGEHALAFLFPELREYEALQLRTCRCNGHHIDGGVVGCFKCGLSREAVVA